MASSGSRSPSPFRSSHPLPQTPQLAIAPSLSTTNSRSSGQFTLPSLAPPRTLRGPRSPANPPRSRSPSPSRSSTPSLPGSRAHSRNSSLEMLDTQRNTLGTAHLNGKLPSPLHMDSMLEVQPPTPINRVSEKALGKQRAFDDDDRKYLGLFSGGNRSTENVSNVSPLSSI